MKPKKKCERCGGELYEWIPRHICQFIHMIKQIAELSSFTCYADCPDREKCCYKGEK